MKQQLKDEIDALAAEAKVCSETLQARQVVDWAKAHPQSALHGEFAWDVDEAAYAHWLQQANQLIRIYVRVIPQVRAYPVRAHIHIGSDQSGYRRTEDVLSNPMFRAELINDALAKTARMRNSFAYLPELDPFFARLDAVIAQFRIELMTPRQTG